MTHRTSNPSNKSPAVQTFVEFIREQVGTSDWVLAPTLTTSLKARGYTVAISRTQYDNLRIAWERQTYGAPLDSLHTAAPELLETLKIIALRLNIEEQDNPHGTYLLAAYRADINAVIAKAEGGRHA